MINELESASFLNVLKIVVKNWQEFANPCQIC